MTTAHHTPHHAAATAPQRPHGSHPGTGHHDNLLKSVLRKAGIVVGTVARVTILGRDGVDL